jgi:hypothetical protein
LINASPESIFPPRSPTGIVDNYAQDNMNRSFCLFAAATLAVSLQFAEFAKAGLIGSDLSGNLYDVNVTTGAATNARPTGITDLMGIAFGPGGVLYGLGSSTSFQNVSLYTINPTTGASTLVGSSANAAFNDSYGEGDLRFNPVTGTLDGIEYGRFQNGNVPNVIQQIFTINPASGATSGFTNLPFFNNSGVVDYNGITFDSTGKIYLLDTASIDPFGHLETGTVGSLTDVKLSAALGTEAGMDLNPANGTLYVADGGTGGGHLYTLNATTGNLSLVGSLGLTNGLDGLAFTPTPEPSTSALLGCIFLLVIGQRIRKR